MAREKHQDFNPKGHELTPTLEDYLRVIYVIERKQKVARPKHIAEAQNVASSTVTAALQSLAGKGMINYEPYELITLTGKGREKAEEFVTRHQVVKNFLEDILGMETPQAEKTTCDMEHAVNREALERFVCFLAFIQRHSAAGGNWLEAFRKFIQDGADGRSCKECMAEYMDALSSQNES